MVKNKGFHYEQISIRLAVNEINIGKKKAQLLDAVISAAEEVSMDNGDKKGLSTGSVAALH